MEHHQQMVYVVTGLKTYLQSSILYFRIFARRSTQLQKRTKFFALFLDKPVSKNVHNPFCTFFIMYDFR